MRRSSAPAPTTPWSPALAADALRERLASVPVAVWLGAIVVVSAAVRFAVAQRIAAPWIMVDELIYSELGRSLAGGDGYAIRGVPAPAYSFVYPVLIAPAYLFDSLVTAYEVVKAINAVVMSLAAVPAYFLARRVLDRGLSLFAAALAVSIPSLVFTGEVMTENAFYPLFLCVALVMVLALERPTRQRQSLLLTLCAVAYATRVQALAFVPAIVVAPLLLGTWRAWRLTYAVFAVSGAAVLALQGARGHSPFDVLGAYATAGEQRYDAAEVARWTVYHVAELDLYVGVFPFAASLVLFSLWRRLPRSMRPYLAASASIAVFFTLEVAAFASLPSVQRIQERNLFYLAPLALIAILVWVDQGAPRPPVGAGAAAVVAATLPAFIPYERLIGVSAQSDTLMLLPLWRLHEGRFDLDDVAAVATAAATAAALAFLIVPRRHAVLLPLTVLGFLLAVHPPITARIDVAAAGALAEGIQAEHRDWIDRTVGDRGEVAVVWTGNASRFLVWQNELFNRSVGRVFHVEQPLEGGLPSTRLTLDRSTGALHPRPDVRFVLTDNSVELAGAVIAADAATGATLYAVDRPLRQTALVDGLYPGDTWSGARVTYTRFDCRGGMVAAVVQGDASLHSRPSTVAVVGTRVQARIPHDGRAHVVRAPLASTGGACVATFAVSPTRRPGGSDPRELGLHFNTFRYES